MLKSIIVCHIVSASIPKAHPEIYRDGKVREVMEEGRPELRERSARAPAFRAKKRLYSTRP
jgi:hypothetical protein